MSALWTSAEAAAATGGEVNTPWAAEHVSIDTRSLPPAALFVALRGDHRDGHEFVTHAFEKGAAAALVDHIDPAWPPQAPLLRVGDTLAGLADLGRAARARSLARIIGVTGSVGKTSTKEALKAVLAAEGPTHASAASYNNHWGVPLSLARLPRGARYGVFELGMNHPGEIRTLAAIVRPHVALVTAIAPAHLEMLGSLEAIAAAKAEIFEGLEPEGVAVLPRDSEHFSLLADRAVACGARVVSFGAHRDADWRLVDAQLGATGSTVEAVHDGHPLRFRVASAGRHAVLNSLAMLAGVAELGADPTRAAAELSALQPTAGRGARRRLAVEGGEAVLLDESYNANPASMAAAIQVLGSQPGRRVAALGDMLELGPEGPALHAALARELEAVEVDRVFTCGPLMRHLHEVLPARMRGGHFESSAELAEALGKAVHQGDVVLVKGSLGSRMRVVVDQLLAASAESVALVRWA